MTLSLWVECLRERSHSISVLRVQIDVTKVSIKKIKNVKGYQIKYSDNKKFNGYWQKNSKKKTYTVKKLDKKTKYYFKVRAYVINGNKKLYGSYSKVKSITVKK